MKSIFMIFALLFVTSNSFAQNEDMMKEWQKYMTPGAMHKLLANQIGEWKADITSWMDPSQPPTKTTGTTVWDSLLGGRYFQAKHKANFMGMDMEGIELAGYDNAKKKFFSTWIDNFGTGILYQEGDYNESTKTFTYIGTSTDPTGKEVKVRTLSRVVDPDNIIMEMFMVEGDKEFKSMEIKFTRAK